MLSLDRVVKNVESGMSIKGEIPIYKYERYRAVRTYDSTIKFLDFRSIYQSGLSTVLTLSNTDPRVMM